MTPAGLGVALLLVVPAAVNLGLAFTDYTGLSAPRFTGMANIRRALADPFLAASLRASLIHVALAVPLRLLVASTAGLLLAAPRPGGRIYRAAVYLPTVIPDVALALLFLWVFNPGFGPVNQILGGLGLPQPLWLGTPWGARWAIVIMLLFPVGEAFLVVLAARQSLSRELYDAAAVDGAQPWQALRWVTMPLITPLLLLLALRDAILTLQVNFVPAYMLTDGGPNRATLFLPIYIYDQAFEFLGLGYGGLITVMVTGISVVLLLLGAFSAIPWVKRGN